MQKLDTSMMPHDEALPVFFVYRFEDIARVLRDSDTFSSGHIIDMIMGPVGWGVSTSILGMDGERHRRYSRPGVVSLPAKSAHRVRGPAGREGGQ